LRVQEIPPRQLLPENQGIAQEKIEVNQERKSAPGSTVNLENGRTKEREKRRKETKEEENEKRGRRKLREAIKRGKEGYQIVLFISCSNK
jgi:hypothetical protein